MVNWTFYATACAASSRYACRLRHLINIIHFIVVLGWREAALRLNDKGIKPMNTKKKILEKVIACEKASYVNDARRKAEHEASAELLRGILKELKKLNATLDTAMQPESTEMPDNPKEEIPIEGIWQERWLAGADAAKALGWQSVSAKALKDIGVRFEQPGGRYAGLLVDAKDLERYLKRRKKYNRK